MGQLDEQSFKAYLTACPGCAGNVFDVDSYLDRKVSVMLADANDDGVWAHDGEKFIDGTYRITCAGCKQVVFTSDACPRCHATATLGSTLEATSHMDVWKRCPKCNATEATLIGFTPATVRTSGGKTPVPKPRALFGEPGFHVVAIACDDCDFARTAPGCPLCEAPAPLRPRP